MLAVLERRQLLEQRRDEEALLHGAAEERVLQKLVGRRAARRVKASVLLERERVRAREGPSERGTHRLSGSFCKHASIMSFIAREYWNLPPSRSSVGGSSMIVLLSALAGGYSELGARPDASSSAVMPNDQMSAARLQ